MEKRRGRPILTKKKDSRIEARICAEYKRKLLEICNCFDIKQSFALQEMIEYFYKATKNPETIEVITPILHGKCPDYFLIEEHLRLINDQDKAMHSELMYICRERNIPEHTVIRNLILEDYSTLTRIKRN